jgi:hypothetical protein
MARQTRANSERNLQSRKAEARKAPQNEERDPLWLPPAPAGFTYGWIRRAVLNQEDAFNIRERQMGGWKPVPSSRHPEMMPEGWGLVLGEQKGYIENAGLLMCECPTHLLKKRKDLERQLTASRLRMPHIEMDSKTRAPTFDDSKVGFERVVTEKVGGEEFKE